MALVFIFRYTTTYPLAVDEWIHVLPRATHALDGEIILLDFIRARGEVNAPSIIHLHSWTVLMPNVLLFNWNLQLSALVNYALIFINVVVVVALLTDERLQWQPILLVVVTALLLAVQQRWNLLVSIHHAIHFRILFVLLTIWFVSRPIKSTRIVLAAAAMAYLGSLSSVVSWMVWIILLLGMIGFGYDDWRVYFIWAGGAALTALTLLVTPGFTLGLGNNYLIGEASSLLRDVGGYVRFTLAYLGAVFTFGPQSNILLAFVMGVLGITVYVGNVAYLWRVPGWRRYAVLCSLLVIYSGMYGGLTAIGRLQQFGVVWGLGHHYMSFGALFWCGIAGLVAASLHHMFTLDDQRRGLVLVNLLVILFGVLFYAYGVVGMWRFADQYHNTTVFQMEDCIVRAAAGEDVGRGCEIVAGIATPDMIQTLYDYRLTGFADVPPEQ